MRTCNYCNYSAPSAQLGDDDGDGPAGQLHQRPQEVGLVHVALAQVARVLDVAVVAHEPHHADNRSGFNHIILQLAQ